jgi:hypothetical protein
MMDMLSNLDPIVRQVIVTVLPAMGVAGVMFGIFWWGIGKREAAATRTFATTWPLAWLGPVVIGLVSINVFMLLNYNDASGWPSLLPRREVRSLWPLIVVAAVVVGVMSSVWRSGLEGSREASPACAMLRMVLRGLLAAGIAALLLRNFLPRLDSGSIIMTLAGAGVLAVLIMQGLERTARADRGFVSAVLLFIPFATAGQVILIGFTEQNPAFAMVALSVIIAVAGVVSVIRPRLHLAWGTMSTAGLLLAIALFQATLVGSASYEQSTIYIALLLLSIWLPWVADAFGVREMVGRFVPAARVKLVMGVVKITLAGVPAAAALGAAVYNKPPPL